MSNMKGLSPFIATVLLIAFTVGVGVILSAFFTSLTSSTSGATGSALTNITQCSASSISVDLVTSTRIVYSNPATYNITRISLLWSNGTIETPTGTSSYINPGFPSTPWNATRGSNTQLFVHGFCQESIPVQGQCASGQSCWLPP